MDKVAYLRFASVYLEFEDVAEFMTEINELFVKLTNGTVTFVEAIESPLLSPPMADRIFGMDVLDNAVAFNLADQMWEKHKAALIAKPSAGGPPP